MENLGEVWLTINPSEARNWIQQSSLSADAKKRLLAEKS
jgi:hypothetical protein